MRAGRRLLLAAFLAGVAAAAGAHPHVFIDTGIEVQFDAEGRAVAVRIVWVYDDFVSLVILEERGLDPDGDGALTAEERRALSGFDMNWDEGFAGDTYALHGDRPLTLGSPSDWTADTVAGRIVSTHLRRFDSPVEPGSVPLVVQVYDPGFYTSYTIASTPVLAGRSDCEAVVYGPDIAAAEAQLSEAMRELANRDAEADFPAVGAAFAEEVRVTCPAGS